LIIEYLTSIFYTEKSPRSVKDFDSFKQLIAKNITEIFDADRLNEFKKNAKNNIEFSNVELKKMINVLNLKTYYHKTNFIIEEPEQNLFPETQRDFIYFLLQKLKSKKDHSLILTTHSPFVLYAINNCILGGLISSNLNLSEKKEFLSYKSWISPSKVNIFEINKENGTLKSIKDPDTGTVNKHYFNKIMNNIMDEYYEMLNFYEYEK
ncbi:MAG: ATP-binding protein, partial [Bacteroidota bacterium]|nr:ATP-binding protein [Bacteroidota bacterium]